MINPEEIKAALAATETADIGHGQTAESVPAENQGIRILSSETVEERELYDVKKEVHSVPGDAPMTVRSCYTKNGDWIGNEKDARTLCDKLGIAPEKVMPSHCVCSIGKSVKDGKWYGWSHRAIHGFQIGDEVKEGDCCNSSGWTEEYLEEHPEADLRLPVGFTAETEEDCRRMAVAFADSVS